MTKGEGKSKMNLTSEIFVELPMNESENIMGKIKENWEKIKKILITAGEVLAVFVIVLGVYSAYKDLKYSVKDLQKSMDGMQTSIKENTDELKKQDSRLDEIDSRISKLEGKIEMIQQMPKVYFPTGSYGSMFSASLSLKENNLVASASWEPDAVIAVERKTDKEYTASELANTKMLVPYMDNGEEIYFLGQYNENNHWDGECLINSYQDNRLTHIMEAVYEDGRLLSYEQVFSYTTGSGKEVWSVSRRTHTEEDINEGKSWNYFKNGDVTKEYSFDTVEATDLISVSDFVKEPLTLEAFYFGETSDGEYNDDSGSAYLVKYDEDGTVRSMYYGKFKDGTLNDTSGEAWSIVYGTDNLYHYCKGKYRNGKADKEVKPAITVEEIEEKLSGYTFETELKWKQQ